MQSVCILHFWWQKAGKFSKKKKKYPNYANVMIFVRQFSQNHSFLNSFLQLLV